MRSASVMGVRERRAREKRFLRQEILDAASELFAREGFENVSMRRIADKIAYSPTTIYLYFKDKAELLEQVCAEAFSRLLQRLTKLMSSRESRSKRCGEVCWRISNSEWKTRITTGRRS